MRKLVVILSSALVFARLLLLHAALTQARVDETGSGKEAAGATPQGLTESLLFDAALGYLREGRYKEAVLHFNEFLIAYPQSGLADNAQFWIGECYRAQQRFEEAIAAYQRVIDDYPEGNKMPRALLHQGFTYLKMDDSGHGKLVFKKLTDELPMTEEAEIARTVLERVVEREEGVTTQLSPDMIEWKVLKGAPHDGSEWISVPEEQTVAEVIAGRDRIAEGYQMKIAHTIRRNWSFPFLLFNPTREQIPEAAVLLTIRNDGTVIKVSFKERSHNDLFDESIVSAIEKSAPLPEFPPDYEKLYDEIEIRFSLKGALLR